jgi:hypothetical protein
VFHLYLNYYYAFIAMGKVSVVTVVRAHLRHHFGTEMQAPQIDDTVEALSKSCIKAAKKMLQLFEDIKRTGNLTRFSFTDFQGCSIAVIIVLLAGILERDSGYEGRVKFGLDCLRRMAEGNTTAKMGVRFVEALRSIANEAVEKLRQTTAFGATSEHTTRPATSVSGAVETRANTVPSSEYNGWVEWLSRTNNRTTQNDSGGNSPKLAAEEAPVLGSQNSWTVHPSTSAAAEAAAASAPSDFSTWDGAAALQQLSGPQGSSAAVSLAAFQGMQDTSTSSTLDSNFLSMLYNDDQAYLMGLTGMDVLNFSNFDG